MALCVCVCGWVFELGGALVVSLGRAHQGRERICIKPLRSGIPEVQLVRSQAGWQPMLGHKQDQGQKYNIPYIDIKK